MDRRVDFGERAAGTPVNPLRTLTDDQLWNLQVLLATACGRNHSSLTRKRRQYYCLLQRNLNLEAELRGLQSPRPPYGVGDIKPGAL